jgi:hypothetical protein
MAAIYLEVGSEDAVTPDEYARIEAGVRAALRDAAAGEVTGGETFPAATLDHLRFVIHVRVKELEQGVRVLRHSLRALGVPDATWITRYQKVEIYEVWGIDESNPPTWGR